MTSRIWSLLLFMLVCFHASAAQQNVLFTAAAPSVPGIPADEQRRLLVGAVTLDLSGSELSLLEHSAGWGHARLVAVWKTNAQGQNINVNGLPTSNPPEFQLDYYSVDWLGISYRDSQGEIVTTSVVSPSNPTRPAFRFVASNAKAGEFYWYEGANVQVIDIVHRTPFLSPGYAVEFRRADLLVPYYGVYRSRSNQYPTASGRADFGLERTPTRTLANGSYDGGHFGVVTAGPPKLGYVFAGRDCLVDGATNPDPYLLTGVQVVVPHGYVQPNDQRIAWPVHTSQNASVVYSADPGKTLPPSTLREPYFSTWNRMLTNQAGTLDLISTPANRTEIDGQNVDELINTVRVAREGANDQANITEVKNSLANGEYLRTEDGKVVTTTKESYADGDLDSLRSGVETGALDVLAVNLQTSIDLVEQVAPVAQEPQTADTASLVDAISIVEEKMYEQTPTSLPLGRRYAARYAAMLPAGWLPEYLEGPSSPGHGVNPITPQPSGVETGAPAYDLNGDGSVDRFGTTDPYQNGFNQIILKWAVTASNFRLGDYPRHRTKCAFAVYAQNDTRPDQRKLLFVGNDGIIYVSKKDRWSGVNYHSFSLSSLVEGTGEPDTYRFALRYQGAAPIENTPEPMPTPESHTVTWTNYTPVTIPGGPVVSVISETGTETVYLYPDLEDEQTLVTASFSDPAFVPRATDGRPVMAAKYVRTSTPYQVNGTLSTPLAPTTTTVYFPAEFRPENLENEEAAPIPIYENSFMWDYTLNGSYPFNYKRGYKFPRGVLGVQLNNNEVIGRFGSDLPLMAGNDLVASGGIDLKIRWQPPAVTELAPTPEIFMANNIRAYTSGSNTFELLSGAGLYLYKGKWISVASEAALRRLLRDMWEWDMYQPRTVYAFLHVDGNVSKPLLNTVRAPTAPTARGLVDINNGVLAQDLQREGGANANANAQRRAELMKSHWFIFSAAKGREHEIEMALRTPKETKLYCVEWDDFRQVQKLFAGYNVQFVFDDETERKMIGEIQTKVFGRTHLQGRLSGGNTITAVTGESGVADIAMANPGKYIFTESDLLYGIPCHHLNKCALLDDLQYGDPQPNQWVTNHKMQIRHPMALIYDDRWSVIVAAYGLNADPRQWTAKWDSYSRPVDGGGIDLCKVAFETAATRPMLTDLYNRMNAADFALAQEGDIVLPPRPEVVAQPVEPVRPAEWTGGEIVFPPVVNEPGAEPVPPTAPWAGTPALEGLPVEQAAEQWVGPEPESNIPIVWTKWVRHTSWPTRPPYTPTYSWRNAGVANISQNGYLATASNNAYTGGTQYFLGVVTWDKPTTRFKTRYQVDNSGSMYVAERPHSPTANATGSTTIYNVGRVTSAAGPDLVLENGKTYYFRLVHNGGGNPNYFHVSASNELHAAWAQRQETANAHLAAMTEYEGIYRSWQEQVRAYEAYLMARAEADQVLLRYQDWQRNYQRQLEEYNRRYAEYLQEKAVYDQYVRELEAWTLANEQHQDAIARWQRYVNARDAWIYLVEHRASEPGVNWGLGEPEPILQGYTFWKTQPECTCE